MIIKINSTPFQHWFTRQFYDRGMVKFAGSGRAPLSSPISSNLLNFSI